MKYTVQKLDRRFTYCDWFKYYIGFSSAMSNYQGPLEFTRAQLWCFQTFGWSAEIRQYDKILKWVDQRNYAPRGITSLAPEKIERPEECNVHWSWTNGYDDLRIYLATDKELAFFQLANQQEK